MSYQALQPWELFSDTSGPSKHAVTILMPTEHDIEQAEMYPENDMLQPFLQHASRKPEAKQPNLLHKYIKRVVRIFNKTPTVERFHPSRMEALDSLLVPFC